MAQNVPQGDFLTPEGLAQYVGVPIATVYQWNHQGTGPRVLKVGRHVRYRLRDVEAWLERCGNGGPRAA